MKRFLLGTLVSLALAGGTSGAASDASPGTTVVVPPSEVHTILANAGIDVPTDTCVGDPAMAGCPPVSEVVVQLPTAWDSESASPSLSPTTTSATDYGPAVGSSSSGGAATSASAVSTTAAGDLCYVHADSPGFGGYAGYWYVNGEGINTCTDSPPYYVFKQEVFSTVQRYEGSSTGWVGYNTCDKVYDGPGTISCTAAYVCASVGYSHPWRNQALGYADINGVGYTGTNTSATYNYYCS